MQCANCGTQNEPGYQFCMKCGNKLDSSVEPLSTQSGSKSEHEIAEKNQLPQVPQFQSQSQPIDPSVSSQNVPPSPSATEIRQAALSYGKQRVSAMNIWSPFAGYGSRRKHLGWLLDGRGDRVNDLIRNVETKFIERQIPGTTVQYSMLSAKGVIVENRPYFLLKRDLVSLGLHIGQYGKDLFVSIVSYLKPPISIFRCAVVGLMVVFWLYMTIAFSNSVDNALTEAINSLSLFGGSSPSDSNLIPLLCLIGPIGIINNIALFLFVVFSIYKWFSEKDILAGLRVRPNEFNEDDLMALEKAVEQTVRISMDEIGLDPDDLKPTNVSGNRLI